MIHPYTIVESLDPRSKIISFLFIILCLITTPVTRLKDFGLYFLLILAIASLSKITVGQVLKKVFVLIPFVFFIAIFVPFIKEGNVCWALRIGYWEFPVTYEGIWTFLNIVIKSSLSILLLVIASLTTAFPDFLKGLEMLRVPRLLVMLMSFMYRYIFVLLDEAKRLIRARSLRYFGSRYREQFRIIGYMVGVLFIRTFERAERIYGAMVVRGFNGEMPSMQHFTFSYRDFLFILGIIISLLFIVSGIIYNVEHWRIGHFHLWQTL
ncbi:MAG: cobalt ECF transporter T component CbiQ [wastewater metagenome]|nr:cobalt ECF transporter T component CbiQ [Candidatus Loosdrechtia aerotolerans]